MWNSSGGANQRWSAQN
nr:hypothetical protein [Streptomyces sp. SID13588]